MIDKQATIRLAFSLEYHIRRFKTNINVFEMYIVYGLAGVKDYNNTTALMRCAMYSYIEPIEFLLDNGVDVNEEDKKGNTALDYATNMANSEARDVLLKYGAKHGK